MDEDGLIAGRTAFHVFGQRMSASFVTVLRRSASKEGVAASLAAEQLRGVRRVKDGDGR